MTKLLIAVVALSVLGFLAYRTLYARSVTADTVEAPTQQLENVRGAAKRIEQNDQQHVDDVDKKTAE